MCEYLPICVSKAGGSVAQWALKSGQVTSPSSELVWVYMSQ